ncbi:putative glutathione transferase [Helianthus annuus]|nr:putative glutathione transferase [Helianthus annuus]KAJ0597370.1 putative glutathione transferase [Helianthus annuus]KAJ0758031.1 putative glutathione transferase [Helianthus annuus]KAJ0761704.1 putative glutathione transferase [Helianthus annuus]
MSSASFRVRIALNLKGFSSILFFIKLIIGPITYLHMSNIICYVWIGLPTGLDYEYKAVNLFKNEQTRPEYLKINPIGYAPALVDGGIVLADSFAIILYLEEKYPQHPLLPRDLVKKAINYQVISFGFLFSLKTHTCTHIHTLYKLIMIR